jgi:hypothetical protein
MLRLIAKYRPDVSDAPVFRRPDRSRVCYPAPQRLVSSTPWSVGWLALLDRRRSAVAALTPVDPVCAVRGMLDDAVELLSRTCR